MKQIKRLGKPIKKKLTKVVKKKPTEKELKKKKLSKQEADKKRLVKSMIRYRNRKKKFVCGNVAKFSRTDYMRINRLLFMGIVIRVKKKSEFEYKVWVYHFPHIWAKAMSPVSAYRRLFKHLKKKGIYLP